MVRKLNWVVPLLILGLRGQSQDSPKIFIAPFRTMGNITAADTAPWNGEFQTVFRQETRFTPVQKEVRKASGGLFGAMAEIKSQEDLDPASKEGALQNARSLSAEWLVLSTVAPKSPATCLYEFELIQVSNAASKSKVSVTAGVTFGDWCGAMVTAARNFDRVLPELPKARAPVPMAASNALPRANPPVPKGR